MELSCGVELDAVVLQLAEEQPRSVGVAFNDGEIRGLDAEPAPGDGADEPAQP